MLILVSLRLRPDKVWKITQKASIGDMVDQIRNQSLMRSIKFLTYRENEDTVKRLMVRRRQDRLNKKPTNMLAEAA